MDVPLLSWIRSEGHTPKRLWPRGVDDEGVSYFVGRCGSRRILHPVHLRAKGFPIEDKLDVVVVGKYRILELIGRSPGDWVRSGSSASRNEVSNVILQKSLVVM